MSRLVQRRRDESGFVLSTRLLALAVSAVAMAALVFVANDPDEVGGLQEEAVPAQSAPSPTPEPEPSVEPSPTEEPEPKRERKPVERGETFVVIYNNTGVTGLAGRVSGTAEAAGWNVVGTDNWYGTIDGTAVYHPPRLRREAQLLAKELGLGQVKQAIDPMQLDRLTVILTSDFSG